MKKALLLTLALSLLAVPVNAKEKKKKDNKTAVYVLTAKTDNDIENKKDYPHQSDRYTYDKLGLVKTHTALFYRSNRENYKQMYFYQSHKIIRMVKSACDDQVLWKNISVLTEADHYHNITYKKSLVNVITSEHGKDQMYYEKSLPVRDHQGYFTATYGKRDKLIHMETAYTTIDLAYDAKGHLNTLIKEDHDNDDSYYYIYTFKNKYKNNRLISQSGTPIRKRELDNNQDICRKRIDYRYKKIKVDKKYVKMIKAQQAVLENHFSDLFLYNANKAI